ncbi:hypothetical protein FIU87_06050 [Bacillus sp. THAF10]|uniref:hypothetical protein n=1 Tax=Bacillus sp. THAF10 TaxID=2587848 RepID=UPI001267BA0F|nr:hypothetical protein [Bacillus sp. THAF10]QFT88196.1 hypothetical protein FIU87_06050 [Bacillus sp. THAF10]
MRRVLVTLLTGLIVVVLSSCGTAVEEKSGQAEEAPPPSLLPSSGDYTFQRYVEEKEHSKYRVLYNKVSDSNIIQVKTVHTTTENKTKEVKETNNFYEETKDGIFGFIVLSEDFPSEWDATDIEKFPKTKIISYPLEENFSWTEEMKELELIISYKVRSIDAEIKTPAKTFKNCIVVDFEEKDQQGNVIRRGNSSFAPKVGWIRHEIEEEVLKDVHKLIKINER